MPQRVVPIFYDDFSNGSQDLPVLSGNGSVSEAGGALVVSATAGTNADWWYYFRNGKLPYVGVPDPNDYDKTYYEVAVRSWSTTDTSVSAIVMALFQTDYTNLILLFSQDGTNFSVYRNWNTASLGSVAVSLPHMFRFVFDRAANTVTVQHHDGSSWVDIVSTSASSFAPIGLGLGIKNWSYFPAVTAQYEGVSIWAEDSTEDVAVDGSGVEDGLAVPEQGNWPLTYWKWGELNKVDTGLGGGFDDQGIAGIAPDGSAQTGFGQVGNLLDRQGHAEGFEDSVIARLGLVPPYRPSANDPEGHPYFLETLGSPRLRNAFVYDATNDPWNHPDVYGLNGYGRDGHLYVSGVQQVTMAPWASEASGADRSSRADFPVRSLIVTTQSELVILDLDNWPTSLTMWMRFRLGNSSNYYMLGYVADTLRQARMINGTLVAGSLYNGSTGVNGGLFCVDFKRTSTDFLFLARADGWWKGTAGRNITHRNQTGNFASQGTGFALDGEYVHYLDAALDTGLPSRERVWVAVGGEDLVRIFEFLANQPQFQYVPVGDQIGPYNDFTSGLKAPMFDTAGWLWIGRGPYVFRCVRDFQGGVLVMGTNPGSDPSRHRYVELIHPSGSVVVRSLAQVGDSIYAATSVGVYRINRFTMEAYLCYTTSGGFGGGRLNRPPDGELLGGESSYIDWVKGFTVNRSGQTIGYLAVASAQATFDTNLPTHGGGAITLLRTYDDAVIDRREYDGLSSGLTEDGAWFLMPFGT